MADGGQVSDLDSETPAAGVPAVPTVTSFIPPTNDTPDSTTRKWVSYLLLILLAAIVVAAFTALFIINSAALPEIVNNSQAAAALATADDAADADRLMRLMNLVFGPVVTLFSSVVGFYFGARTAKESGLAS